MPSASVRIFLSESLQCVHRSDEGGQAIKVACVWSSTTVTDARPLNWGKFGAPSWTATTCAAYPLEIVDGLGKVTGTSYEDRVL